MFEDVKENVEVRKKEKIHCKDVKIHRGICDARKHLLQGKGNCMDSPFIKETDSTIQVVEN